MVATDSNKIANKTSYVIFLINKSLAKSKLKVVLPSYNTQFKGSWGKMLWLRTFKSQLPNEGPTKTLDIYYLKHRNPRNRKLFWNAAFQKYNEE